MIKERSRLLRLCLSSLEQKGISDSRHKERLKQEVKEIDAQAEHEYLLDLHDEFRSKQLVYPENENNLLVDYLLDLTDEFDIETEPRYVQGEFPDIDVDYLRDVRDYLKRVWAAKTFGQENICEIGTYGTAGIKSALLDMTNVHGLSKSEAQQITVKMEDKDDEGKTLEWDKALEMYPDFNAYCEAHPDVAAAAKLMLNRNKSGGVHAGGLIISDRPLDGFVPLEVRSVKKDNPNGVICSSWTEGLAHQDLQPVGLIKFDLLVINNLKQIALGCELVKQRHGLEKICAFEGGWDFSDTGYLNDPDALRIANQADLKCIFQFDSEGIRKLVKRGGVTSFDDLVAYSALYRPGPLNMGMDARYCKRKKGEEPYNLHPLMEPILGKTYGVMVFQEQVMEMLRVIGNVPDMHTEKVRKAISKKKVKDFIKYKEMFVENGMVNLSVNAKFLLDLWDQIESFAEYGFNKSHACAYTYISSRLLWLKAHYPIEFYTAILMCEKDEQKFKDYKLDAKYHGIEICPVDINKSKENFGIADDKVFFGFKNIKTVGEAVAERIVENQPYENFPDFLIKFGTDAGPIKAMCAIGVFDDLEPDYDREHLRKFHEFYKDHAKKRRDRQKRFELSRDKKLVELKDLLLEHISEDDSDFEVMSDFTEEAAELWDKIFAEVEQTVSYKSKGEVKTKEVSVASLLQKMAQRRDSSIKSFNDKEKEDDNNPITMDQFNVDRIQLDKEELGVLRNSMTLDGETNYPKAEGLYYGFQWIHQLETSPDYTGRTIDAFLAECEVAGDGVGMIEALIKSVRKRTSKKNVKTGKSVEFYTIEIEDANARCMNMNVWMDDYTRFREELKKGNMLKIQARPPSGGFNTLTFKSVPKKERKFLPPKEDDVRILKMKEQEKVETPKVDLDDLKFDVL